VDVPSRRHDIVLSALTALVTATACAGLLAAAILVPAPHAVVALIIVVAIALPMLASWDLSRVSAARRPQLDLAELRRQLDRIPETPHPLGG
jgi:hypothetical protein